MVHAPQSDPGKFYQYGAPLPVALYLRHLIFYGADVRARQKSDYATTFSLACWKILEDKNRNQNSKMQDLVTKQTSCANESAAAYATGRTQNEHRLHKRSTAGAPASSELYKKMDFNLRHLGSI